MPDPRDRIIRAAIELREAREVERKFTRGLRSLDCTLQELHAGAPKCWEVESRLPPDYCESCRSGLELAQGRKVARAARRAAIGKLERAVIALDKTIYGIAARAA